MQSTEAFGQSFHEPETEDFQCIFPIDEAPPNDIVFSEILCVSDISFRVRLHTRNGAGPFKEVAVFLDLNDWPDSSMLMIQYTITIHNCKDEMLSISMDDTKLLSPNTDSLDFGFLHFMTSNLLLDPTAGYLDKGEISLTARVCLTRLPPPGEIRLSTQSPLASSAASPYAARRDAAIFDGAITIFAAGESELRTAALQSELDELPVRHRYPPAP